VYHPERGRDHHVSAVEALHCYVIDAILFHLAGSHHPNVSLCIRQPSVLVIGVARGLRGVQVPPRAKIPSNFAQCVSLSKYGRKKLNNFLCREAQPTLVRQPKNEIKSTSLRFHKTPL